MEKIKEQGEKRLIATDERETEVEKERDTVGGISVQRGE